MPLLEITQEAEDRRQVLILAELPVEMGWLTLTEIVKIDHIQLRVHIVIPSEIVLEHQRPEQDRRRYLVRDQILFQEPDQILQTGRLIEIVILIETTQAQEHDLVIPDLLQLEVQEDQDHSHVVVVQADHQEVAQLDEVADVCNSIFLNRN